MGIDYFRLWSKYGLSIDMSTTGIGYANARIAHDRVAQYLETHPNIAKRYLDEADKSMRYFDVLYLAEREISL